MKRLVKNFITAIAGLFVLTLTACKDGVPTSTDDMYMKQIKESYGFKPGILDSMDWFLLIGGTAVTVVTVAAFIFWLFKLLLRLASIQRGKATLKDEVFWKRMGISLLIIVFVMSSVIFAFLENFWEMIHSLATGGS